MSEAAAGSVRSPEAPPGSCCICLKIGDPQPQLLDDLSISSELEQAAALFGLCMKGCSGHEMLPRGRRPCQ
jgi:hypothetical protein